MQIIQGTTDFELRQKSAVAIGKFDGIHRGHMALLSELLKKKEEGLLTTVFTFDPPAAAFFGDGSQKELSTREEKRKLFEHIGIDVLVEFPLNAETAATPPQRFVEEILVKRLNVAFIAAGADLSFGYRGKGDSSLLKELSPQLGYEVRIIDKVMESGREISSTAVREEVEDGRMEQAERLLGRPYAVGGIVGLGKQLGRKLGMPTVNLYPEKDKLLPPFGVYYAKVDCEGERYDGITNIGYKPTVSDEPVVSVETYLYDVNLNLYGKEICVSLLHFKRPEQKFDSIETLKTQMQQDIAAGDLYRKSMTHVS